MCSGVGSAVAAKEQAHKEPPPLVCCRRLDSSVRSLALYLIRPPSDKRDMTISYSDQFFKLLLRWKGSLWKTIWKDLVFYLILYYLINMVYRFGLDAENQAKFRKYITLFNDYTHEIPLTFLLGFYVAMIIRRWWEQCQWISWPDQLLFNVSALIRGTEVSIYSLA